MKKRIVICCDGTWNEPEKHDETGKRTIPTNVLTMVRAVLPSDGENCEQVIFYDSGIGTGTFGKLGSIIAGITGYGISAHIQSCYRFLANNYKDGDEIFLFGFSRGAYTARSLIGMISAVGLLEKMDMEWLSQAYDYYRTTPKNRSSSKHAALVEGLATTKPPIKFLGVWDTVGSLGAPTPLLKKITKTLSVGFHDSTLSSLVENAFHAIAIDERRGPFQADLWKMAGDKTRVEQVWFAGEHSNIGGGFSDTGLSDVALDWMLDRAIENGLCINEECRTEKMRTNPLGKLSNTYSITYRMLEFLGVSAYVREIGMNENTHEMIHESVVERLREINEYRPENLISKTSSINTLLREEDGKMFFTLDNGDEIPIAQKILAAGATIQSDMDKRSCLRTIINEDAGKARIEVDGQLDFVCQILDFSKEGGARIEAAVSLMPGDVVILESTETGRREVEVVWTKDKAMGLKYAA